MTINGENVVLNVTAGDVFSFVIQSADSDFGSSAVTISEFSVTPVPLPPSMGLFGFALGGMMMMQRRRAAQEKSQH
mgnify:CR=1 FL=1